MKKKAFLFIVVLLGAYTASTQIVVTSTQAHTTKVHKASGLFLRGEVDFHEYHNLKQNQKPYGLSPKLSVGYQFNSVFSLNMGVSYQNIPFDNGNLTLIPAYIGFRLNTAKGTVQPFLDARIGIPVINSENFNQANTYKYYYSYKAKGVDISFDLGLSISNLGSNVKCFNLSFFIANIPLVESYWSRISNGNYSLNSNREISKNLEIGFKLGFDIPLGKKSVVN